MQTLEQIISTLEPLDQQSSKVIFGTALNFLSDKDWYVTHDGNNNKITVKKTIFKKTTQRYQITLSIIISDNSKNIKTSVTQTCYCIHPILGDDKYKYTYELNSPGAQTYSNTNVPKYMFGILSDLYDWVQERDPIRKAYAEKQQLQK